MTDKLTFGARHSDDGSTWLHNGRDTGLEIARTEGDIEFTVGDRWESVSHALSPAEVQQLVEFLTAGKSQPAAPMSAPDQGLFAIQPLSGSAMPMTWVTYKLNEAGQAYQLLWRETKEAASNLAKRTPGLYWGRVSADGMFIQDDR